jgi:hypothetical protein
MDMRKVPLVKFIRENMLNQTIQIQDIRALF